MLRPTGPIDRGGRTIIKQRILTGVVILPLLVLFIAYASTFWFAGLVGVATLLALLEFYDIALPGDRRLEVVSAALAGTVLIPVLIRSGSWGLPCALAFFLLFFATLFLFRFRDLTTVVGQLTLVIFGFLYIPLLLGHLALLRGLPFGRSWVFFVLLVAMCGDTAAYFTGITCGRRKLYPAISPNKSVEGAAGGLAGSLGGALIAHFTFFTTLGLGHTVFLGVLLGATGQVGDLFESMLKRGFGVKDSGRLFPGHGGILDRLDSLLFVFPVAYYYAVIFFGTHG